MINSYQRLMFQVIANECELTDEEQNAVPIVGILHDILEDTDALEGTVRDHYGDIVADAVVAITHLKDEPQVAYLERVCHNKVAMIVKRADVNDNTIPWRLNALSIETRERLIAKYDKTIIYLESAR